MSARWSPSSISSREATVGFSLRSAASQAERWSSANSSARSRYGLRACHCSGLSLDINSSNRQIRANVAMEIDARLFPLSLYCTFRQVLQGGNFRERKAAEKLHVHQFGKLRLDFRQFIQGVADRREFLGVDGILVKIRLERSDFEFAAALDCISAPGMINDQSAHHPRGITHEPRPVRKAVAFARCDV